MVKKKDEIKTFIRLTSDDLKTKMMSLNKDSYFWGECEDGWVLIDGKKVNKFDNYDDLINFVEREVTNG